MERKISEAKFNLKIDKGLLELKQLNLELAIEKLQEKMKSNKRRIDRINNRLNMLNKKGHTDLFYNQLMGAV